MNYNCPKCGSENTQKISVVIQNGTDNLTQTNLSFRLKMETDPSDFSLARKFLWFVFFSLSFLAIGNLFGLVANPGPAKVIHGVIGIPAALIAYFLGKALFEPSKKPLSDADKANNANLRENGFYCNRCDNMYIPS